MNNHTHEESEEEFEQPVEELVTYCSYDFSLRCGNVKKVPTVAKVEKHQIRMMSENVVKSKGDNLLNKNVKIIGNMPTHSKVIVLGDCVFRSNFESGNLSTVHKINLSTYEVHLNTETNAERISNWFYFAVEGLKGEVKFIIKGFTKTKSLYNEGMKICCRDASDNKWKRVGTKICYIESYNESDEKAKFELHFSYFFKSSYPNSIEFSYCFPYTYTNLIKYLSSQSHLIVLETLGKSYENRDIPLVKIGNEKSPYAIIISSRVHPGETVGSHMMEGFLKELLSQSEYAKNLKENFLFVIIPMINPDGVVNGNYRFSGAGYDLNRKWKNTNPKMHPEIFLLKNKIKEIKREKEILMFIDLHGHSRQKNVFFYGCSPKGYSNVSLDETKNTREFPYLMSKLDPTFCYEKCSYSMSKEKEGTSRVYLWNYLKIPFIYTMEASFCGVEGSTNFLIEDYRKIGERLCEGICLHFNSLGKEVSLNNNINIKEEFDKKMTDFYNNPKLAEISFEGNSSESEPELGEIPENKRKKKKDGEIMIQKKGKISRISKYSNKVSNNEVIKNSKSNEKKNSKDKIKKKLISGSFKLITNSKLEEKTKFPWKNEQIKTVSHNLLKKKAKEENFQRTQTNFYVKNEQMNRPLTNRMKTRSINKESLLYSNVQKNHTEFFTISSEFGSETNTEKHMDLVETIKKKAISYEGTQYRRVRKIAEETNKSFSSQMCNSFKDNNLLVKGLKGINSLIQIEKIESEKRCTSLFPVGFNCTQNIKGSTDGKLKRQSRTSDRSMKKFYVNGIGKVVQCFGKQIF